METASFAQLKTILSKIKAYIDDKIFTFSIKYRDSKNQLIEHKVDIGDEIDLSSQTATRVSNPLNITIGEDTHTYDGSANVDIVIPQSELPEGVLVADSKGTLNKSNLKIGNVQIRSGKQSLTLNIPYMSYATTGGNSPVDAYNVTAVYTGEDVPFKSHYDEETGDYLDEPILDYSKMAMKFEITGGEGINSEEEWYDGISIGDYLYIQIDSWTSGNSTTDVNVHLFWEFYDDMGYIDSIETPIIYREIKTVEEGANYSEILINGSQVALKSDIPKSTIPDIINKEVRFKKMPHFDKDIHLCNNGTAAGGTIYFGDSVDDNGTPYTYIREKSDNTLEIKSSRVVINGTLFSSILDRLRALEEHIGIVCDECYEPGCDECDEGYGGCDGCDEYDGCDECDEGYTPICWDTYTPGCGDCDEGYTPICWDTYTPGCDDCDNCNLCNDNFCEECDGCHECNNVYGSCEESDDCDVVSCDIYGSY